jgi:hypothetical protein
MLKNIERSDVYDDVQVLFVPNISEDKASSSVTENHVGGYDIVLTVWFKKMESGGLKHIFGMQNV